MAAAEVFLASRLEGLSCKQIAFLTGLSEGYIERQMSRAIYKLMKQMRGHRLSWRSDGSDA